MAETVTIYIDGQAFKVPKGANLVDAAKLHGVGIPVFCYHPKLEPVGMCRMCLVEMGSVSVNKDTGQPELGEDGQPVIRWMPRLQTACTQTAADGMAIRTTTQKVVEARDDILEFLLTSHPLDCPICDKGGECPLQNLTIAYGPGKSRFTFEDKIRLDKHVPLGELIVLDRERCIQCARCTRFCAEIVGDDVLAFHERGRRLQIVTISEPPFDTKFSGNTTDICPVGALTTTDFRFGARPWELHEVPTICPHCPVGCNLSAGTRADRDSDGKTVIKRIMPRQNEQVNEIWICDKGRFGHHHTMAPDRLKKPLMRDKRGQFIEVDWPTAYKQVVAKFKELGSHAGFLAGSSISNEDAWELGKLAQDKSRLGTWPATMTGADVIAQVGVGTGTRLQDLGPESVVLVIASDFEEEAPVWWLQVKQAADRGAKVIVANGRDTKLDRYAHAVIHYRYGDAVAVLNGLAAHLVNHKRADSSRAEGFSSLQTGVKKIKTDQGDVADILASAQNLIIFAGGEGLTLAQHAELMQAAANLLIITGHVGRPDNGLVPVWPGANFQGLLDMGFSPEATAALVENPPAMWVIAEADPVAEDVRAAQAVEQAEFVVVVSQFLTATAAQADIVLPVQSFAEREGSYTNGFRRVQRFYAAQSPIEEALPAWKIFAQINEKLGGEKPRVSAAVVMRDITQNVFRYAGMSYPNLAHVEEQFPDVGGDDLYYGGTAYSNRGGLGIQWPADAETQGARLAVRPVNVTNDNENARLVAIPVRVLYDRSPLFEPSELMHLRIPAPHADLNQEDAAQFGIADGDRITISVDGVQFETVAMINGKAPAGFVLLPQRLSEAPVPAAPVVCAVQKIEE